MADDFAREVNSVSSSVSNQKKYRIGRRYTF